MACTSPTKACCRKHAGTRQTAEAPNEGNLQWALPATAASPTLLCVLDERTNELVVDKEVAFRARRPEGFAMVGCSPRMDEPERRVTGARPA